MEWPTIPCHRGAMSRTGPTSRSHVERRLLERMADDMRLRGYSPRTRKVYLGHVRRFLRRARPPADSRTSLDDPAHLIPEVRRFLLHLLGEKDRSHSYANQAVSALKYLFEKVMETEGHGVRLPRPKVERKLPVVMSREEVARLLKAPRNRKHRAILMTVYSAGLRVGEVVRLKVSDIDPDRMLIHVRQAKGRRDRYVMLSPVALDALREYWREHRPRRDPKGWLFPGARPGRHLTERSVQKVFHKARRKAGIRKKVSVHSLRHAFATHLLESGTDVRFIQKLLGHKSTKTTEIYTRVTKQSLQAIRSPLDGTWRE